MLESYDYEWCYEFIESIMSVNRRGFTLIEILVFTAIVSIFYVVAAAVSAYSLGVMKTNENKVYATHYADEVNEWLRNQKESDWTTFLAKSGQSYCFSSATITSWPGSGVCATTGTGSYSLGGRFNRTVTLQTSASNVEAASTVSWIGLSSQIQSITIRTVFAQIE